MPDGLWFDVEEGYNTTYKNVGNETRELWFDVEEGYNTTLQEKITTIDMLWFDVEEGYNTTAQDVHKRPNCCGLM